MAGEPGSVFTWIIGGTALRTLRQGVVSWCVSSHLPLAQTYELGELLPFEVDRSIATALSGESLLRARLVADSTRSALRGPETAVVLVTNWRGET